MYGIGHLISNGKARSCNHLSTVVHLSWTFVAFNALYFADFVLEVPTTIGDKDCLVRCTTISSC